MFAKKPADNYDRRCITSDQYRRQKELMKKQKTNRDSSLGISRRIIVQ